MSLNQTKFDVIAIGDTTQDVFLQVSSASVQCAKDDTNCLLCFDYADKIAVDAKTDISAVGNAANHAIGISRLGFRSSIYTIVGDDIQGHIAGDVFREEGVDPRYVVYDKGHGTNFSTVLNFKGERTILVFHEPRDYQLPRLLATQWLYLTSASGDGVEQLHDQVLSYIADNSDVKLAFNPGTYQIKLGGAHLGPLLVKTELLFLNREEAAKILGVTTRDIKELFSHYHEIGVKNMVITDGPKGAYASDGSTIWQLNIFAGPVVERTGAGDSFGSGFLAGLLQDLPIPEAMLWGNANSTSVVQYIGAREGLLDQVGIEKMIAENSSIQPKVFTS